MLLASADILAALLFFSIDALWAGRYLAGTAFAAFLVLLAAARSGRLLLPRVWLEAAWRICLVFVALVAGALIAGSLVGWLVEKAFFHQTAQFALASAVPSIAACVALFFRPARRPG